MTSWNLKLNWIGLSKLKFRHSFEALQLNLAESCDNKTFKTGKKLKRAIRKHKKLTADVYLRNTLQVSSVLVWEIFSNQIFQLLRCTSTLSRITFQKDSFPTSPAIPTNSRKTILKQKSIAQQNAWFRRISWWEYSRRRSLVWWLSHKEKEKSEKIRRVHVVC